jgi:hypothetical protein
MVGRDVQKMRPALVLARDVNCRVLPDSGLSKEGVLTAQPRRQLFELRRY